MSSLARLLPNKQDAEAGMTLVELIVAMVILGIIFAGTSAALINGSRITQTNEGRVQATAQLNRLHEDLQGLPWDLATLYDSEIEATDLDGFLDENFNGMSLDFDPDALTFDGEQMVVEELPEDCDDAACGRDPLVPDLASSTQDISGREFQVITIITRAADVGDGNIAKRFTTLVSWEVFGRDVVQQFQSVRAPVAAEIEEFGLPSALFTVAPTVVALNDEGFTTSNIEVRAEFSDAVDSVSVSYDEPVYDTEEEEFTGDTVERTVPLGDVGTEPGTTWGTDITSPAGRFEPGELTFRMSATVGFDEITAERILTLIPESDVVGAPTVLNTVQANPLTVDVGNATPDLDRLCSDLRVTADVDGLEAGGEVTASFLAHDGEQGRAMSPVTSINPSGTTAMELVFAEGEISPWRPIAGSGGGFGGTGPPVAPVDVTVTFTVVASNISGEDSNQESSGTVTIRRLTGACP